jgi:chromatin assembly factor 1 subunit A
LWEIGSWVCRSHITAWQGVKKVTALEKPERWGLRRKPKVSIYRELRLQGAAATTSQMTDSGASRGNCDGVTSEKTTLSASIKRLREAPRDEELKVEVNGEDQNCMVIEDPDELPRKELCSKQWKLLQFDKSYRPAYYGTFSKTRYQICTCWLVCSYSLKDALKKVTVVCWVGCVL